MGVAGDERIEGPRDVADVPRERPLALVLLEHAPEALALQPGKHPGDVRVHRPRRGRGEERDGCPDHAVAVVQPDGVVAGVRERAQQVRRHAATRSPPQTSASTSDAANDLIDGLERADLDARRGLDGASVMRHGIGLASHRQRRTARPRRAPIA